MFSSDGKDGVYSLIFSLLNRSVWYPFTATLNVHRCPSLPRTVLSSPTRLRWH
ncbi:hypothetical protein M404DRAFT_1002861 [Pisolithus tinctorius Marx 270]|uniref:Uncharacterized protein n=1 Tax=Pisolithus tinctorius Marx 270 TaxID=870435 RepID=A0A0C3IY46_PISTI|nr:hypothetical protein M404DRAFT_1002861 [Pisolithus tinctorius Marx 270]